MLSLRRPQHPSSRFSFALFRPSRALVQRPSSLDPTSTRSPSPPPRRLDLLLPLVALQPHLGAHRALYSPKTPTSTISSTSAACTGESGGKCRLKATREGEARAGEVVGGELDERLDAAALVARARTSSLTHCPPSSRAEPARRRRQLGLSTRPRPPSPFPPRPSQLLLSLLFRVHATLASPQHTLLQPRPALDPPSPSSSSSSSPRRPPLADLLFSHINLVSAHSPARHARSRPARSLHRRERQAARPWRRRLGRQERDRSRRARGASLCTRSSLCMTQLYLASCSSRVHAERAQREREESSCARGGSSARRCDLRRPTRTTWRGSRVVERSPRCTSWALSHVSPTSSRTREEGHRGWMVMQRQPVSYDSCFDFSCSRRW